MQKVKLLQQLSPAKSPISQRITANSRLEAQSIAAPTVDRSRPSATKSIDGVNPDECDRDDDRTHLGFR
jgi:hypothetical protein